MGLADLVPYLVIAGQLLILFKVTLTLASIMLHALLAFLLTVLLVRLILYDNGLT